MTAKRYVEIDGKNVHYRVSGQGTDVIVLHDSVKSSGALLPLMDLLSDQFRVFAFDLPGYGDSTSLLEKTSIEAIADVLAKAFVKVGIQKPVLYGRHTGAKVSVQLAATHGSFFQHILLDGLSLPDAGVEDSFLQNYLPAFTVDHRGAFISTTWTQIRDLMRWFPWYDKSAKTRMAVPAKNYINEHEFSLDFYMAGENYRRGYGAALAYLATPIIMEMDKSVKVTVVANEHDVLAKFLEKVPSFIETRVIQGNLIQHYAAVKSLIQEFSGDTPVSQGFPDDMGNYAYLDTKYGQVRYYRSPKAGKQIVLFHDLPGCIEAETTEIEALEAKGYQVIAIDMPGNGNSNLAGVNPEQYPFVLNNIVSNLTEGTFSIYAKGISGRLAVILSALNSNIEKFILDGFSSIEFDANLYAPKIAYSRDGGHLMQIWLMLRDMDAHFPWYRGELDGIRKIDTEFNAVRMYKRFVSVLKNLRGYDVAIHSASSQFDTNLLKDIQNKIVVFKGGQDPLYTTYDVLTVGQVEKSDFFK